MSLEPLLAFAEGSVPGVEVEHRAVVVSDMAEKPPEALRAAHVPVRDDEDVVADSRGPRGCCESVQVGARVAPDFARRRRQVFVDVEERRTRDVAIEVELVPAARGPELPAAIDELVAHARSVTPTRRGGVLDRAFERSTT